MKTYLLPVLYLLVAASLRADEITCDNHGANSQDASTYDDAVNAQPKLLRLSAIVDGSGRIIFTRQSVRYEHKFWKKPVNMMFDGEPWIDLSCTPPAWREIADHLDLTKAWIVRRKGRDVVALEQTTDGFDLYLCDSPNGAADYEVTIAIPRRVRAN